MARIRFEAEIEVTRLYSVPVFAESLEDAAVQAKGMNTAVEIEALGDSQDYDINLIGVTRQVGRKMYQ